MKSKFLRELNFKTLLGYPDEFLREHQYKNPICCDRYCVECETSGVLKAGEKLTLMSHGCDTSDFEEILKKPIISDGAVTYPILFLLEDPGGRYGLGKEVPYNGCVKEPPVNHYYWSPSVESWPQTIEEVLKNGNFYGSYFAYIMQKHWLANVYITNLVKCKRDGVSDRRLVEETCVKRFLEKEIGEFSPRVCFCFGAKAFEGLGRRFSHLNRVLLYHPSFIQNRSQTIRKSRSELIALNDQKIEAAIKNMSASPK